MMQAGEHIPILDRTTLACEEAQTLWGCGVDMWLNYLAEVAATPTPMGALQAHIRLMTGSADLVGRATGTVLEQHGLRAPLLSDA